MGTTLAVVEIDGTPIVEGEPNASFLRVAGDIDRVVEACFSARTDCALLYSTNLTPAFFDLSSGEAGAILQKLRNYRLRLAVVIAPDTPFSTRFGEMVEEEKRGDDFALFDTRAAATRWLCREDQAS